MSDIEETNVTYGELADLEFEFDQVETEISECFPRDRLANATTTIANTPPSPPAVCPL